MIHPSTSVSRKRRHHVVSTSEFQLSFRLYGSTCSYYYQLWVFPYVLFSFIVIHVQFPFLHLLSCRDIPNRPRGKEASLLTYCFINTPEPWINPNLLSTVFLYTSLFLTKQKIAKQYKYTLKYGVDVNVYVPQYAKDTNKICFDLYFFGIETTEQIII